MSEHRLPTEAAPTEPSKTAWNSLPQEIRSHILSFAEVCDLKEARLVCWNWAYSASPFLFEMLWLTPWTLDQLDDKRSFQTICPHVRHLVLFSVILPLYSLKDWQKTYKEWQNDFEKSLVPSLSGASESEQAVITEMGEQIDEIKQPWPASEVVPRFQSYADHFRRQTPFVKEIGTDDHFKAATGKCLSVFEEAIRQFYHLSEVTIGDDLWFAMSDPSYPPGKRCNVWQDLEDLNDPFFNLGLPTFGQTFLISVLRSLGHSGRSLRSLYTGAILFPTFESFTRLGQEDMKAVDHVVGNLNTIDVVLDYEWDLEIQDENVVGQTWLANTLSAAGKLQYMSVVMVSYSEIPEDPLKLFWSKKSMLGKLRLANMAVTEDLFFSFLRQNAQTLKEIELERLHLQDGHGDLGGNGWGTLFKPFAGLIWIKSIRLLPALWTRGWTKSSKVLFEDPTCAQLLGEGLPTGVREYEEEKFNDLCRALSLVHDTIPTRYTIHLVAGFAPRTLS
ncbi:MAG: hypothetical protein LQ352_005996 [Teloschistes flavicans]|nr:MAG: hypothetical protein LQ352_005996 [Teloschistes flavicans]